MEAFRIRCNVILQNPRLLRGIVKLQAAFRGAYERKLIRTGKHPRISKMAFDRARNRHSIWLNALRSQVGDSAAPTQRSFASPSGGGAIITTTTTAQSPVRLSYAALQTVPEGASSPSRRILTLAGSPSHATLVQQQHRQTLVRASSPFPPNLPTGPVAVGVGGGGAVSTQFAATTGQQTLVLQPNRQSVSPSYVITTAPGQTVTTTTQETSRVAQQQQQQVTTQQQFLQLARPSTVGAVSADGKTQMLPVTLVTGPHGASLLIPASGLNTLSTTLAPLSMQTTTTSSTATTNPIMLRNSIAPTGALTVRAASPGGFVLAPAPQPVAQASTVNVSTMSSSSSVMDGRAEMSTNTPHFEKVTIPKKKKKKSKPLPSVGTQTKVTAEVQTEEEDFVTTVERSDVEMQTKVKGLPAVTVKLASNTNALPQMATPKGAKKPPPHPDLIRSGIDKLKEDYARRRSQSQTPQLQQQMRRTWPSSRGGGRSPSPGLDRGKEDWLVVNDDKRGWSRGSQMSMLSSQLGLSMGILTGNYDEHDRAREKREREYQRARELRERKMWEMRTIQLAQRREMEERALKARDRQRQVAAREMREWREQQLHAMGAEKERLMLERGLMERERLARENDQHHLWMESERHRMAASRENQLRSLWQKEDEAYYDATNMDPRMGEADVWRMRSEADQWMSNWQTELDSVKNDMQRRAQTSSMMGSRGGVGLGTDLFPPMGHEKEPELYREYIRWKQASAANTPNVSNGGALPPAPGAFSRPESRGPPSLLQQPMGGAGTGGGIGAAAFPPLNTPPQPPSDWPNVDLEKRTTTAAMPSLPGAYWNAETLYSPSANRANPPPRPSAFAGSSATGIPSNDPTAADPLATLQNREQMYGSGSRPESRLMGSEAYPMYPNIAVLGGGGGSGGGSSGSYRPSSSMAEHPYYQSR